MPIRKNYKAQICLVLALSLLLLGGCVSPIFAQTNPPPVNTQNVLNSLMNSFAGCLIAGQTLIPEEPCSTTGTQASLNNQQSAMSFLGMGISAVATPPLSTGEALADLRDSLGVKSAYAQNVTGSGSNVIAPVKALWQIMRNFAYSMFILLFLVVGLMLMFRQKMNAQTVISVQAALPGLIIGLVLITFSYLLAAALVDLAFLFIPLVAIIFDQASPVNIFKDNPEFWKGTAIETSAGNYNSLLDISQNANVFSFWKAFTLNFGFSYDLFGNTGNGLKLDYTTFSGLFSSLFNFIIETLKAGANLLVAVIVIVALFIQMIRLFASLVRSYITIMAYTFLGPIMILMASIPGRGKEIENWWKTILANALVFPAVFAGFFFGGMIIADNAAIDQTQFGYTLPLFSGLPVQVIKYILGLMIILGTPAIPGMVKEALGVKDMKGIPEIAQAGFSAGGNVVGTALRRMTPYDSIMKQREAAKEHALRNMYNDEGELGHLARPGWSGSLRNRLVTAFQPTYVTETAARESAAIRARRGG